MAIKLDQQFRDQVHLGNPISMDCHYIDVLLKNDSIVEHLVVRGGIYNTGYSSDPNGESELSFHAEEILNVRPAFGGLARIFKRKKWPNAQQSAEEGAASRRPKA